MSHLVPEAISTSSPIAPPPVSRALDESSLLLQFVRERDVHCPRCDYNLRNLTQPTCPECEEHLALAVRTPRQVWLWFYAAIAPGVFSGIAAPLASLDLVADWRQGALITAWHWGVVSFGALSGIVAVTLMVWRKRFARLGQARQGVTAIVIWAVHILVFLFALLAGILT